MIIKLEKIKNEFIEIILKERGILEKNEINLLNRYTQLINERLEKFAYED